MRTWLNWRFWRWSLPVRGDRNVLARYRHYSDPEGYGFGRVYAMVLALGFDGIGT